MFSEKTLLNVRQGNGGTFVDWLKTLGLEKFISHYPIPKLVEWGWLVPYSRIVFSDEFFHAWQNFPNCPCQGEDLDRFDEEFLLWDSTWRVDKEELLWFLHPFFRPDYKCYECLRHAKTQPPPQSFYLPNGRKITPYAEYFFHWQAYALIDVIRYADCITPILNTPDVEAQAQGIVRIAAIVKDFKPCDILIHEKQWGGLTEIMTALSHYQSFCSALYWHPNKSILKPRGAKLLADYLNINAAKLEQEIKEKLLVLAQNWLRANEQHCVWTLYAWPYLQSDIAQILEWLCYLNEKNFSHYFELWQYPTRGRERWVELAEILPYEFYTDQNYFLRHAYFYEEYFENLFPPHTLLKQIVSSLSAENYPFSSFLSAFRQMHEHLSYKPKQPGGLDFRELRPLDFYSLLAIRAEGCLRDALDRNGLLSSIPVYDQSLLGYIIKLAKHKNINQKIIDFFKGNAKNYTHLGLAPKQPIHSIMDINPKTWKKDDIRLLQAFLSCLLARNYFAHHTYLDQELTHSKESGFMLTGILVTIFKLLEN